jgi:hypothetical protein
MAQMADIEPVEFNLLKGLFKNTNKIPECWFRARSIF